VTDVVIYVTAVPFCLSCRHHMTAVVLHINLILTVSHSYVEMKQLLVVISCDMHLLVKGFYKINKQQNPSLSWSKLRFIKSHSLAIRR
jgi:hypothetical protein